MHQPLACPGSAVSKHMSHIHAVMSPSVPQSWLHLDLVLQDWKSHEKLKSQAVTHLARQRMSADVQ